MEGYGNLVAEKKTGMFLKNYPFKCFTVIRKKINTFQENEKIVIKIWRIKINR